MKIKDEISGSAHIETFLYGVAGMAFCILARIAISYVMGQDSARVFTLLSTFFAVAFISLYRPKHKLKLALLLREKSIEFGDTYPDMKQACELSGDASLISLGRALRLRVLLHNFLYGFVISGMVMIAFVMG